MEISIKKVKSILEQLPIAYYLKNRIDVVLTNNRTSMYDANNNKIGISYPQVCASLHNIEDEEMIETHIRCLLYHEVSHAIITPKYFCSSDIYNIFEDERIETIFKKYYLGVDFKKFITTYMSIMQFNVNDAKSYFYSIVRLRVGNANLVKKVDEIIMKYKNITQRSSSFEVEYYKEDIQLFYEEVCKQYELEHANQEENTNSNEDNNEDNNDDNNDTQSEDNEEEYEENEEDEENDFVDDEDEELDDEEENDIDSQDSEDETDSLEHMNENNYEDDNEECTDEENEELDEDNSEDFDNSEEDEEYDFTSDIQCALKELSKSDLYDDTELENKLKRVLLEKAKNAKKNGGVINSYSGVIDPRSCTRQDYKFFLTKNRSGNIKRYSKIKLNLFIDTSGSFCDSELVVNKLLHSLSQLEKNTSEFEFDVVSMNMSETLLDKSRRYIYCCGCNSLSYYAKVLYDKLQDKTASNINIVLFDGYAFSGRKNRDYNGKNFSAFDHDNVTIISDSSNMRDIETYCNKARKIIIDKDYANVLIDNVLKAIEYGLK